MWHPVTRMFALAILTASCGSSAADWQDCKKSEPDRRIVACSEIIAKNANDLKQQRDAYIFRGSAYLAKSELDLAIADQSAAIRLDPNYAVAYDLRANVFSIKGDHDRALVDFNEAIRLDPKHAFAHNGRGLLHLKNGAHDRAIIDLSESIRLRPNFSVAYSNRARAYREKGDRDRALSDFRKVLELPAATDAHRKLQEQARASIAQLMQPRPIDSESDPTLNETIIRLPLLVQLPSGADHQGEFVLTTFKPHGPGPFPTVIMSHGHAGLGRADFGRNRILWSYWMERGFAVLAPTRIGHGVSWIGMDPERPRGPGCDVWDYGPFAEAGSAHIRAAIDYALAQSWVDKDNLVLAGASAGGLGSLVAAATRGTGVKVVVNFVGGAGGLKAARPARPCNPENVAALLSAAGKNSSIPTIWFYAENDQEWGPTVPRLALGLCQGRRPGGVPHVAASWRGGWTQYHWARDRPLAALARSVSGVERVQSKKVATRFASANWICTS